MHNDLIIKPAIEVKNLEKVYLAKDKKKIQKTALRGINLTINQGEIFGLLGPNGAGKSTFINILAGLVIKSKGEVNINGFNLDTNVREARQSIGVVPQELTLDPFFSPEDSLELQAGMYGVRKKNRKTKEILSALKLNDVAKGYARRMSGGMKRRLMVGKAMVHSPPILVLDEPTAGVDVELRKDMWKVVDGLRKTGVTIILTTHYIEEAEAIADRVAVINQGEIIVVDNKIDLLKKMGHKKLTIELQDKIEKLPAKLNEYNLIISEDKYSLIYNYNLNEERTGITKMLQDLKNVGLRMRDLKTEQNNLEKIFVTLVRENNEI